MQWVSDGPIDYPPLEQADEARREAEAKDAFFQEHWQEFLQKYPDHFVAVLDEQVIAHAPDLVELIDVLEKRGLKPTDIWMRFVDTGSRMLIL
jgi:hypothetical protein